MMKKKVMAIGILGILVCSVGIEMVIANTRDINVEADGVEFTADELQDLYHKYNITENDIKFAKGELPYYLEGTILDSDMRVIASQTGKPPEGLKEGDYDIVISTAEMFAIIDDARERFMDKYGVDPANPKVDIVDGVPLPKEEVGRLVKSGKIDLADAEPLVGILGGPSEGPHAISGKIYAHIFIAKDDRHNPTEYVTADTSAALCRFEDQFGVDMIWYWYYNYWDASDISPADSCKNALKDLAEDEGWIVNAENDIVIGWLHDMDHNGMAYPDGMWDLNEDGVIDFAPYCVCSDTAAGVDWPHDNIVQHETSHLFNAPDHGYTGPYCVMTYMYAGVSWFGDVWCSDCEDAVDDNIWGW